MIFILILIIFYCFQENSFEKHILDKQQMEQLIKVDTKKKS